MAYDNENIFARILRGQAHAHIVTEDDHCVAFMDVMPQSPGHTLVIPREAAQDIFELSTESLAHLIVTTQRVAKAVKRAFDPAGVMVTQLNGAAAGQTVFHIHFHVVPRYASEGTKVPPRYIPSPEELALTAAKLHKALTEEGAKDD